MLEIKYSDDPDFIDPLEEISSKSLPASEEEWKIFISERFKRDIKPLKQKNLSRGVHYRKLKSQIEKSQEKCNVFLVINHSLGTSYWKRTMRNIDQYYSKIKGLQIVGIDLRPTSIRIYNDIWKT